MKAGLIIAAVVFVLALMYGAKHTYDELVVTRIALESQVAVLTKLETGMTDMYALSKGHQVEQAKQYKLLKSNLSEVMKYAQDTSIVRVDLSARWVWLYDMQILGIDPASTTARDLQANSRTANDIEVMEVLTHNEAIWKETKAQLDTCQAYVKRIHTERTL